jgi:hypothetical protein
MENPKLTNYLFKLILNLSPPSMFFIMFAKHFDSLSRNPPSLYHGYSVLNSSSRHIHSELIMENRQRLLLKLDSEGYILVTTTLETG